MIEILYTHFHEPLTDGIWNACLQKMPEKIQMQILRFQRWQDRHASLLGKTMLLEGLKKQGHHPDSLRKILYTEYNRPFIYDVIDFNISHSGNYVVCAINNDGKVGVDIEKIKPLKIEEFRDSMTPEEWRSIQNAPSNLERFYELWTLKESVIKGDGRGLTLPLANVRVEGETVRIGNTCWYTKKINLDPHYNCHIAANHKISSVCLHQFDYVKFCNE